MFGLIDDDHDANVRTWRVPERVRETLLDHAERQVRDRRGDPAAITHEAAGDVEPAAARARDHLLDKGKIGCPLAVALLPPRRSTSRSRSSVPWRADSEMASNASPARTGSESTNRCPAAAWITITLIAWPTMSCSSLAIRARSCRRAISVNSSRSSSSSWARSASSRSRSPGEVAEPCRPVRRNREHDRGHPAAHLGQVRERHKVGRRAPGHQPRGTSRPAERKHREREGVERHTRLGEPTSDASSGQEQDECRHDATRGWLRHHSRRAHHSERGREQVAAATSSASRAAPSAVRRARGAPPR